MAVPSDVERADAPPTRRSDAPRLKRTFYLPLQAVLALERLQSKELEATGKKPELSEMVTRAIQLLAEQSGL